MRRREEEEDEGDTNPYSQWGRRQRERVWDFSDRKKKKIGCYWFRQKQCGGSQLGFLEKRERLKRVLLSVYH